ncbi:hypothetical protein DM860_008394 [Cuscuta australis]|uniref:H15 domain-containing protein n=2 Tax=Cuscuta sect. Cleistogrammica TaxID=1824901 RepID=A0A328D4B7_9ASTE|nr:hypothetical protein DM860_008394 [Cuscuta australis]
MGHKRRRIQRPAAAEPAAAQNPYRPKNPTENLRALLMKMVASCSPSQSLSPVQKSFVNRKLREFFPHSRPSPDHPPYSWMILNAIEKLDNEGGCNAEEISHYILKQYPNLPWAHETLLSHHLVNLRENGEIFETTHGSYALGGEKECTSTSNLGSSNKRKKKSKSKPKQDSKNAKRNAESDETTEQECASLKTTSGKKRSKRKCTEVVLAEPNGMQGQQNGGRLTRLKKVVQELEEPNRQTQQDSASKLHGEEKLNGEAGLEKGRTRSGRQPKRNRRYDDFLEDKKTVPGINVLPCEGDPAQHKNELNKHDLLSGEECRGTEEEHGEMKTKSGEGLSINPACDFHPPSNQQSLHPRDSKHAKNKGTAKTQEIRRSPRISIATTLKQQEHNSVVT